MLRFDIVTEDTAYGINIKVVPAKTDEYGWPNGFKYRLTIQAPSRSQATNSARYAISEALKPSAWE